MVMVVVERGAARRGGWWRQSRFMDGRLSKVVAGEAVR
jgi:hypothetical protein